MCPPALWATSFLLTGLALSACSDDGASSPPSNDAGSGEGFQATGGTSGGSGGSNSAGGSPSSGGTAGATHDGNDDRCDRAQSIAHRELVATALDELFVDKDLGAIDRYWAEPYAQHNPIAQSGVEPFRDLMSGFVTAPSFSYERLRTLGECDLVVVQGRYSTSGVIFDMFRVRDGKIVEHWDSDVNQASGSDGPTALEDDELTSENRARVLAFFDRVLLGGDLDEASDFVAETFQSHRASGTGPEAFVDHLEGASIEYVKVHHVIADGNFVFTLSEARLGGTAYALYELFRVAEGSIVEHWDARRVVPASTTSGLDIF